MLQSIEFKTYNKQTTNNNDKSQQQTTKNKTRTLKKAAFGDGSYISREEGGYVHSISANRKTHPQLKSIEIHRKSTTKIKHVPS